MRSVYQETLAERSMYIESSEEGEYWNFTWYVDPLSKGLTQSYNVNAHVTSDGVVSMLGFWIATNKEESLIQENIMRFIKERYERFGIDEEHTESRN